MRIGCFKPYYIYVFANPLQQSWLSYTLNNLRIIRTCLARGSHVDVLGRRRQAFQMVMACHHHWRRWINLA
jgi:hypothetical protein